MEQPRLHALFPGLRYWAHLPAFIGWLTFSLGIAVGLQQHDPPTLPLYTGVGALSIVFTLCLAVTGSRMVNRALLFLIAGMLCAARYRQIEANTFRLLAASLTEPARVELVGTVASPPQITLGGYAFTLATELLTTETASIPLDGRKVTCIARRSMAPSTQIRCVGRFRLPKGEMNPGAFDERLHQLSNHCWGSVSIDSMVILRPPHSALSSLVERFRHNVHRTAGRTGNIHHQGVLLASFLGEKGMLTSSTKELYRSAGIYHLLAISGLHVGILIGALVLVLGPLPLPKAVRIAVVIGMLWAYLFLIGFIPSLTRAVLMATVLMSATILQRRSHPLNALGLAGIAWLAYSPLSLFTPGYQLSFAATFGILALYTPLAATTLGRIPSGILAPALRGLLSLALISAIGFAATAPVLLYHFGDLSLAGLATNLVAVTIMTIAMNGFFFAIACEISAPPLAACAMWVVERALTCVDFVAEPATRLPLSLSMLPRPPLWLIALYGIAGLCTATVHSKNALRAAWWGILILVPAAIPAWLITAGAAAPMRMAFLSTRTGALTGFRFPNGKIWVVGNAPEDGYNNPWDNALRPWLRTQTTSRFAALVLPQVPVNIVHDLAPMLDETPPKSIVIPSPLTNDQATDDFRRLLKDAGIELKTVTPGTRFLPAPHCTVTVGTCPPPHHPRPLFSAPARIQISIGGTQIKLIPPEENCAPTEEDRAQIHRCGDSVLIRCPTPGTTGSESNLRVDLASGALLMDLGQGGSDLRQVFVPSRGGRLWREVTITLVEKGERGTRQRNTPTIHRAERR